MRRGYVLSSIVGRHDDALADYERRSGGSAPGRRPGLGGAHPQQHRVAAPAAGARRARARPRPSRRSGSSTEEGLESEAARACHNRGDVAFIRGDLPTALRLYDEAAARFAALGLDGVQLALDRSEALLAAGLAAEAAAVAEARLARGRSLRSGRPTSSRWRAEALLAAGEPAGGAGRGAAGPRRLPAARAGLVRAAGRADRAAGPRGGRPAGSRSGGGGGLRRAPTRGRGGRRGRAGLAARRPALARRGDPALRLGAGTAPTDCRWCAPPAGSRAASSGRCRRPARRAAGLPARPGRPGPAPGHAGQLRAARPGHGLRRRPGGAGARPRRGRPGRARSSGGASGGARPPWPSRPCGWRTTTRRRPLTALRDNARRLQVARSEGADTARLEVERARLEDRVRRLRHQTAGSASGSAVARPEVDRLVEATGGRGVRRARGGRGTGCTRCW